MAQRDYYAVRTGKQTDDIQLNFEELKQLILSYYMKFEGQGYFAEAFGQHCVDDGPTVGKMGTNIDLFVSVQL